MNTLYAPLAELQLQVEGYGLRGLSMETAHFVRRTTVVELKGKGCEGHGEDITYQAPAHEAFQSAGPVYDLAGSYTLEEFSHRLDAFAFFTESPGDPKAPLFRRWAFESAALDLALRQNDASLGAVLGRTPRPLHFVVSMGLGGEPSLAPLEALWKLYPNQKVKLDAAPGWSESLIAELAATGTVTTVDLKGQYKGDYAGTAPDAALYRRVAEGLPDAWIEDPGWTDETRAALADHMDRITYDAPMCSLSALLQVFPLPKSVNVKPSRYGRLSELFRVYAYCEAQGIAMYGGGQFELGPGRDHVQRLASLFHPETPNDVAPTGFNDTQLSADLPHTPTTSPESPGFGWSPRA